MESERSFYSFAMILVSMPRTRDFAVFLATGTLLLCAITATLVGGATINGATQLGAVLSSQPEQETFTASVSHTELNREDTIKRLKEKISRLGIVFSEAPPQEVLVLPAADEVDSTEEKPKELRCEGYQTGVIAWNSTGLKFVEVEGARIVFREVPTVNAQATATPAINRVVVAQLPLRSSPVAVTCLSTSLVGVAVDGSLIYNNEGARYQALGSGTLIGYTLDGFPLYGQSDVKTDQCGGVTQNGQYRYYMSAERDAVINCFAGTPVTL